MYIPRRNPVQSAIFDMFRGGGGNSNNQNQNQQQNSQNNQQQQNQPNPGNMEKNDQNQNQNNQQQNQDQNQNQNQNKEQNKSPLAEFAGLWDTPPAPKEGEAVQPDWNEHSSIVPELNVDPKKMFEAARRIDFSKVMNPEKVAAALKGDAAAFTEVINTVAQATFANMAMSATKISKAMMSQMAEKLYSGALPHHFRRHAVNSQIDTDLPILSDPAVAPMFESFKQQMQVKYPKASAQEISQLAKKMVTAFADAVKGGGNSAGNTNISKGQKGGLNKTGTGEEDWGEFFNLGPSNQQ